MGIIMWLKFRKLSYICKGNRNDKNTKDKFLTGPDEIPDFIIKSYDRYIVKALTDICSVSISDGYISIKPEHLKIRPLNKI